MHDILCTCRLLAPAGVFFAAIRIGHVDDLLGPELALVARAVLARRQEFAAGRWCARQALQMAGGPRVPIPKGPLLEPIWPDGFGGSLTHDGRFAVAAGYRLGPDIPPVGIDLVDPPDAARLASVAETALSAEERVFVGHDPLRLATIFSAKEAAIKILAPRVGRFMEFTEISAQQRLDGYLLTHRDLACRVHSRARLVHDLLLTVATAELSDG
ncbi:4'-phosphopantetheinyl transferase family protein [Mesorhizobium mediterraneum]|uniref:4'-phosphopantetheinyl transferase family protein n=1 Tax=Mesorhizobium mediterraneum TaxID=43617 RepID=UPI001AED2AE5|nr:4'-phosphopantetheinyl transferase superfamily protein [Mesorhizobium mediterraneum]